MSARLAGLALLASVFAGCSAEFDPSSRVTGLRVLAVRADNPYAPPGSTVNLTALAVDPAARELDWGGERASIRLLPRSSIASTVSTGPRSPCRPTRRATP